MAASWLAVWVSGWGIFFYTDINEPRKTATVDLNLHDFCAARGLTFKWPPSISKYYGINSKLLNIHVGKVPEKLPNTTLAI
jgi:hypothetical protein